MGESIHILNGILSGVLFYFILRILVSLRYRKNNQRPHSWGTLAWLIISGAGVSSGMSSQRGGGSTELLVGYFILGILPGLYFIEKKMRKSKERDGVKAQPTSNSSE